MPLAKKLFGPVLLLGLSFLVGCIQSARGHLDEEKEPQFLEGKSRENTMDFDGAIEAFERALEANPRSASAHFELGCLYDQKQSDPAAAIYHYNRYIKWRPDGEYAAKVRERIVVCKQELARTVSLAPITPNLQHEFDNLIQQNKSLTEELDRWRATTNLARGTTQPGTSASPIAPVRNDRPDRSSQADFTGQKSVEQVSSQLPVERNNVNSRSNDSTSEPRDTSRELATAAGRIHTVKSGETPSAIARKYGLRVESLMAANPRLDARRLRVGQNLAIPTR